MLDDPQMGAKAGGGVDTDNGGPPTRLSLIVLSGEYGRVHYALVLAAAAAAISVPVTLFFTLEACLALEDEQGWRRLHGANADEVYGTRGVVQFEDLLAACRDLDVQFLVCEMGLRALGLEASDLRDDLGIQVTGAVTALSKADGAVVTL